MSLPLRLFLAGLWLVAGCAFAQPIYRVIDENGNVTYTDQKPSDDAEPIDLPDLDIVGQNAPEVDRLITAGVPATPIEPFQMRIAEPAEGSVIANQDGHIDIRLESNLDIPPAAQLVVYLNDQPQPPIRTLEVTLTDLSPGDYRVRAELQTASGRRLATTASVAVRLIAADPG